MKKIIFILFIAIIGLHVQGQETKTKKEIRAEKKAQQLKVHEATRVIQEKWASDKTFVLEALQVFGKKGDSFHLSPNINFVYVNGDQAIIQLSFDGLIGWNGVGGITIKGRITKYEVDKENPNKPIYIKMSIQGATGFQEITLWISSSGSGEAQITDIKGNRIRFTGDIVSLENSKVFIGMESF